MSWIDEIAYLLQPVGEPFQDYVLGEGNFIGNKILKNNGKSLPDPEEFKLAILGVGEGRRFDGSDQTRSPNQIREALYSMFPPSEGIKIADLGDIIPGKEPTDTDAAIKLIVGELLSHKKSVIFLGGSHDLTYALHQAFDPLEIPINISIVDKLIDLGELHGELTAVNFLNKIILHEPSYLFSLSVLGYQSYYADPEVLSLMDKLMFDYYRLGELQSNLNRIEPILRNCDLVSIDMGSVSNAAAPGSNEPNGFSGEEICRIARYAGLSNRTSVFGLFNYNGTDDTKGVQAKLIGQMIWYFIEGYSGRVREFPLVKKEGFFEFKIHLPEHNDAITFFKSKRTDKWWLKVPYSVKGSLYSERQHLVPCSYEDYKLASEGEIPDLWWKTVRKLS